MKLLIVQLVILFVLNGCLAKKKGGGCGKKALCNKVSSLEEQLASLNHRVELLEQATPPPPPTRPPTTAPPPKPKSCQELFDQGKREDGIYDIDAGAGETPVYCVLSDLEGCGGGFTMVMKIDGTKDTFKWDAALWTNEETYNTEAGNTGFDHQETKLATYSNKPFTKVCIGMDDDGQKKFKGIDISAASLHALIAGGHYHQTSLGREAWKGLLKSGSLQQNCNREGFNAQAAHFKIRIGILSNEQNDCGSDDSYIGFGSTSDPSTGNRAYHGGDAGDRNTKVFGYILVK